MCKSLIVKIYASKSPTLKGDSQSHWMAKRFTKVEFIKKAKKAFVRVEGVEPPRREALDPKSSMSTSSIIPALKELSLF